jgi:hypothetical protein
MIDRDPSESVPTPLFAPAASIMVVELDEPVRSWCRDAAPGVTLLWVAHSSAARERAMVTRPLVIVIPDRDGDAVDLADVAESTGAELIRFLTVSGRDYFMARLHRAIADAETRRRTQAR